MESENGITSASMPNIKPLRRKITASKKQQSNDGNLHKLQSLRLLLPV